MMVKSPESGTGHTWSFASLTRAEKVALIFFAALGIFYLIWHFVTAQKPNVDLGQDIPVTGGIVVQVEGAVESPGMYYLPAGARLSNAIEAAGGLTSQADQSRINLATPLTDGQRVDIPSLSDSNRGNSGNGISFSPVDYPTSDGSAGNNASGNSESGKVNINTANQFELQSLPGIGEELAIRIIEYRTIHGGFRTIEEIMQVNGIGQGKFDGIKNRITVGN